MGWKRVWFYLIPNRVKNGIVSVWYNTRIQKAVLGSELEPMSVNRYVSSVQQKLD